MAQNNPFLQNPFDALGRDEQDDGLLPGQQSTTAPAKMQKVAAPQEPAPTAAPEARRPARVERWLPPAETRPIFEAAAREFNVPVNVLMALGHQESRYNQNAIGTPTQWGRAKGMMQYLDDTAKNLGINPFDPSEAIPAAARQIRERLDKGYSMEDAVKEHFAGPNRKLWGEKTAAYGREVMEKTGRIGSMLFGDQDDYKPTPSVPDASALQQQLDAEEPGRYRVLSADEVAAFQAKGPQTVPNPMQIEKAPEARGFVEEYITDPLKRGWASLKQGMSATGAMADARQLEVMGRIDRGEKVPDQDDIVGYQYMNAEQRARYKQMFADALKKSTQNVADLGKEIQAIPQDPIVAKAQQAKSFDEWWSYFKQAPFKFIANTGVESLPQMAPGLVLGGVGGLAARSAVAGAAGMGAGSYAVDYPATVLSALAELGVNTNDPDALTKALSDPKLMENVRNQAHAHASVVGALDAVSGGRAGATLVPGKTVARQAANIGAKTVEQGALGAAGEAGGQIAQGKKDLEWGAIAGEFAGEFAGAPAEIAGAAALKAREAAQPPAGPLQAAVEAVAEREATPRVTAATPEGQVTGQVVGYREDAEGNFVAQVVGDDGQVHTLDSRTGVQVQQVEAPPAGPLEAAITAVAEENAAPVATPPAQETPMPSMEVAPTQPPAAPAQAVPDAMGRIEPVLAPPASAPAVPKGPRPIEQQAKEATTEQLQQRLEYINQQAKASGGWTKMFVQARDAVQKELDARAAAVPPAPAVPTTDFATRADANAAVLAAAEQTGLPHKIVEAGDRFTIEPITEVDDVEQAQTSNGQADVQLSAADELDNQAGGKAPVALDESSGSGASAGLEPRAGIGSVPANNAADVKPALKPTELLKSATRKSRIKGMENEPVPDPVAREILAASGAKKLDTALAKKGVEVTGVIGAGAGSVVLDAGDSVVRLGRGAATEVPKIEGVLQPIESGNIGDIRFDIMPKADTAGITDVDVETVRAEIEAQGYTFADAGADNVGRVNGKPVVIDPGAIEKVPELAPNPDPVAALAAEDNDDGADIPPAFYKKVKVSHEVWIQDENTYETHDVRADQALESVREDIANLRALLDCLKG